MRNKIIVLLLMTVSLAAGCGKKNEPQPEANVKEQTVEIEIPTMEPSEVPEETKEPEEVTQPEQSYKVGKEESMTAYFRFDFPESYSMLYDEENLIATIAKDGIKAGKLTLYKDYRKKKDANTLLSKAFSIDGYASKVRTYEKGTYSMQKITVQEGVSKEEIESGKLFGGSERILYVYYKEEMPTPLLLLEFTSKVSEEEMDELAETVEFIE